MLNIKKRILIYIGVAVPVIILSALGAIYAVTKAFAFKAALHIFVRLLVALLALTLLDKSFKDQITKSRTAALVWCGVFLIADLVIADAFRFILSGGVSSVLFLPACIPLCLMVILCYSAKDTAREKSIEKRFAFIIGIPLLILALYFEIISFIT